MSIRYKIDVLAELKKKGYPTTRIRAERLMGQSYLQQLRHKELVSWGMMNTICSLLDCQVGDIVEYVREDENTSQDENN